jgi:preprotein translocase subunit SecD
MKKKLTFFGVLLVTLAMVYVAVFGIKTEGFSLYGAPDMRFGIDIRGGVEAVFQPVGIDTKPTLEQLEAARAIIETRLDQKNVTDRDVTVESTEGLYISHVSLGRLMRRSLTRLSYRGIRTDSQAYLP